MQRRVAGAPPILEGTLRAQAFEQLGHAGKIEARVRCVNDAEWFMLARVLNTELAARISGTADIIRNDIISSISLQTDIVENYRGNCRFADSTGLRRCTS